MRPARWALTMVVATTTAVVAGCGDSTATSPSGLGATGVLEGAITVSAAASLRGVLTEIGDELETEHPGVEVTFTFDASSALATQILEGAPVDVYAAADEVSMGELVDEGVIDGEPRPFAGNRLVIVTKPGNPSGVRGLADLADVGVISLCGAEVPCGRYASEALARAGVAIPQSSVSRGHNATATLTAVAQGDAVAGIVYATDAAEVGDAVEVVELPPEHQVVATYLVGALRSSRHPEVADAVVAQLLGARGQAVLAAHGFLPPP